MSKKQKKVNAEQTLTESKKQDQISQGAVSSKQAKTEQKNQDKKKDKKKKQPKEKKGLIRKTKETASELKKVTWPTFGEVVKKTGIVIAFVLIFGVFLYGVNTLLGYLSGLLVG